MHCEKGSVREEGELASGVGGRRTSAQGTCEHVHGRRFSHLDEQVLENQTETAGL